MYEVKYITMTRDELRAEFGLKPVGGKAGNSSPSLDAMERYFKAKQDLDDVHKEFMRCSQLNGAKLYELDYFTKLGFTMRDTATGESTMAIVNKDTIEFLRGKESKIYHLIFKHINEVPGYVAKKNFLYKYLDSDECKVYILLGVEHEPAGQKSVLKVMVNDLNAEVAGARMDSICAAVNAQVDKALKRTSLTGRIKEFIRKL
jgi:hypothetical protein